MSEEFTLPLGFYGDFEKEHKERSVRGQTVYSCYNVTLVNVGNKTKGAWPSYM